MPQKSVLNITLPLFDSYNEDSIEHSLLCNVPVDNQARLQKYTHIDLEDGFYVLPEQIQSNVCIFTDTPSTLGLKCDALVTNKPHLPLLIKTTDSVPVLLSDPINKVIAIANATPGALENDLIGNTIKKMLEHGAKAQHIAVILGPYKKSFFSESSINNKKFLPQRNEYCTNLTYYCETLLRRIGIHNVYNSGLENLLLQEKDDYSKPKPYLAAFNVSIISIVKNKKPEKKINHIGNPTSWENFTRNLTKVSDKFAFPATGKKKSTHTIERKYESVNFDEESFYKSPSDLHKQIDLGTIRKIKRGKVTIESTLDLHGETEDTGYSKTVDFILESYASGLRYLLVIVGKGRTDRGIIRTNFVSWLENNAKIRNLIISTTEALPHHGGEGAYYVFLRRRSKTKNSVSLEKSDPLENN